PGPASPGRPFAFAAGGAALLALVGALSVGCHTSPPPALQRFQFTSPHMGTLFTITMFGRIADSPQDAARAAFQRIANLDEILSDYQADSELMKLCDQPAGTPVPVSSDLFEVLEKAQRFSQNSGGAFDVTVGPYVRLWRFARKRKSLPSPEELARAQT